MPTDRLFVALGAVLALLGVAGGAFGAHALRERLSVEMLTIFETGVRYQVYHALGLIGVGLFAARATTSSIVWAGWLFVTGSIIFSGSLYLLALTGLRWFGAITPLGGVCFLAGWATFVWSAVRG
jgi:uncharacterized membrane protein YgdD (TMEM256/DUF423 family)